MRRKPFVSSKIFSKALFSNFLALLITVLLIPGLFSCLEAPLASLLAMLLSALVLLAVMEPMRLILLRLLESRPRARIELRYFMISYVLTLIESAVICQPILVLTLSSLHILIFLALSYLEIILEQRKI